ncbi:MAG: phosphate-selective porin OprO/OprP [Gammaproteobacteria bacterium]
MLNKTRLINLCGAMLIGMSAAISTQVYANNEAMLDLLKILRDKGSISNDEYQLLTSASKADGEKVEGKLNEVTADVKEKTKNMAKITTEGKFKIESQDGQHSFQPIGRIFWDAMNTDSDGSAAIFAGGTELRRARLGFEAQYFKHWKSKLEYDFAGGSDVSLKDGWISYDNKFGLVDNSNFDIKVGQHHVPFGITTINSSKNMTFARRPLFADGPLQPARQAGVAAKIHDDNYRWHLNAGVFYDEPDDGTTGGPGENRVTASIRATGIPFMTDEKHMLQVGASYMYMDQNDTPFRVRQRAITHKDTARMFDTGSIANGGVDSVDAFDLEALVIYGPFYALGEYVHWSVDGGTGPALGTDFDLSGWSIEGGWFITGESKKFKGAAMDGISPSRPFPGGPGAWEVAARFENLDLNDTDAGIIGGDGDVFTVGMNWYPIKNVRFMLDYNKLTDFDRTGDPNDGTNPSSITMRSSVYW